jgi:kynurenine formamidase
MTDGVPTYAQLRARTDAPPGSSWGVFGEGDEVGTINFLTPERVLAASRTVRRGAVFNLDYPLDFGAPSSRRKPPAHTIVHLGLQDGKIGIVDPPATILDDQLDGFFLQGSTQIDGLRHHAHPDHGFYGGAPAERMVAGDPTLGVNRWADHGIVGRGVLIDVARHREAEGRPLDHAGCETIDRGLLEETLAAQGTELQLGDMVLVRTDWMSHLAKHRDDPPTAFMSAGLAQTYDVVEWLWDSQVPLVATDNMEVEARLGTPSSEFGEGFFHARLHDQLIPLLGMALGELWRLEELAADCADDGVYEFMLVAKPLNLTGGVGTPANAVAIK